MPPFEITVVSSDDDLHRYAAFDALVEPDNAHDFEELRDRRERFPGNLSLLAEQAGETVGRAACGDPPGVSPQYCWARVDVLAHARRQGIGAALAERLVTHVRERGRPMLESWVDSTA